MNRFIRLSFITVALSTWASAAVVTMSSAAFTGQFDLVINEASPDNTTTNLSGTYAGTASTVNLANMGETARLLLGTLSIDENVADGETNPNITELERDALGGPYGLTINVNTVQWGVLTFIAGPALFDLSGFVPGASDDNTLDGDEEVTVNFSSLFQDAVFNNITIRFSIMDDNFGTDQILELNQGSAAETLYLRATVIGVGEPPNGEVPEPATMALAGSGLVAMGVFARRRQKV